MLGLFKKHENLKVAAALACTLLVNASCLKGPGIFSQQGTSANSTVTYEILTTESGGATTGTFDPRSTATQLISAASGTAISGAGVAFPPGALSIDTTITLEEGSTLATAAASSALGLGTSMRVGGPSVVISAVTRIDANIPFSLQLPISSGSGLALSDDTDNIIVIYKVYNAAEDKYFTGIYTKDQLDISSDSVSVETKYFGAFQAAYTEIPVTKAVQVEDDTPILTKNDEYKLPEVKWTIGTPEFNESIREVAVEIGATGFGDVVRCTAMVFDDIDSPFIDANSTDNQDEIRKILSATNTYNYRVPSDDAMTLYFKFGCKDEYGRDVESPFSDKIEIAAKAKASEVEEEETPVDTQASILAITNFDPHGDPNRRTINSGGSSSTTVSGKCDASKGSVEAWTKDTGISSSYNESITCTAAGTFSFNVYNDSNTSASGEYIKIKDQVGGHLIKVWQSGVSSDAWTVIYNVGGGASPIPINVVTTASNLAVELTNATTQIVVLGANIDLAGWTSINFPATKAFDGDGFSITNLDKPLITSMSGGRISNVNFSDASISKSFVAAGSPVAVIASSVMCTADCVISNVSINSSDLTVSNTGSPNSYGVGLIAGSSDMDLTIESSDIYLSSITTSGSSAVSNVGGVIGIQDGPISNVWVHNLTISADHAIGAIAGSSNGPIREASVSQFTGTSTVSNGEAMLGGVAGKSSGNSSIFFSSVKDSSLAAATTSTKVGGIAGELNRSSGGASIYDSFTEEVTISGFALLGGLVGNLDPGTGGGVAINNSYAAYADITGLHTQPYCGGLVGQISSGSATTVVESSFAFDPTLSCGATYAGAVFGQVNVAANANNVHFYSSEATTPPCVGVTLATAFTSAQCSSQNSASFFTTNTSAVYYDFPTYLWDFSWPWYFPSATSLPRLRNGD